MEEWRPITGWPGYEVSSLCRVRHVKLMAGQQMMLRAKGKQTTTTATALYKRAFAKEPTAQGSMMRVRKPGALWRTIRSYMLNKQAWVNLSQLAQAVLDDDKNYGVKRQNTKAFRDRLSHTLTGYVRKGLLRRAARNRYALGDANALHD